MTPRIIIGISGASGFQYGVKALELLQPLAVEVHLVVSKGAEKTCELETDYRLDEVMALADVVHPINHLGASISSGSFKTLGMLVAPCSMRSLGAIAHCLTDNLLTRAADVVLKERRRLVLLARETPLNPTIYAIWRRLPRWAASSFHRFRRSINARKAQMTLLPIA